MRFREITDSVQGDFYLEFDGTIPNTNIRFIQQDEHLYNTDEILDGEDRLPDGYDNCCVMVKPYDKGTLLIRVNTLLKAKSIKEETK